MNTPARTVAHGVRVVVSLLWDTGRAGDGDWRWSKVMFARLFGPGSVPLAAFLFAVQHEVLVDLHGFATPAWIIAAATGGSVILARFNPLLAWLTVIAVMGWVAAGSAAGANEPWPLTVPAIMALLVCQFAVARDHRAWISVGTLLGYLALGWSLAQTAPTDVGVQNLVLVGLLTTVALLTGLTIRSSRQARHRLAIEERVSAEERLARRMLEERARIARELHDMVAHHMSVITVQASTAEYRLPDVSAGAAAEFQSISEQARTSLQEMRRLLTVLRGEDEQGIRLPQPDLSQLSTLVDSVRRAGITVDTDITVCGEIADAVSLTGFRVVQEALSNVVRHAPDAKAQVRVATEDQLVHIRVHNDPSPAEAPATPLPGAGLGIAGMRERVSLLGGQLRAEATAAGGFLVEARIPLSAQEQREQEDR